MDAIDTRTSRMREPGRQAAPQVFEALRQQIISLLLVPGSAISRTALQREFGLSSTPIRDALIRLQEEGLVEIYPQSGTVVSPIDIAKARQAQFLRRSLELEAVRVATEATNKSLARLLTAIVARQKDAAAAKEFDMFADADQEFHHTLYAAAGVPDLWFVMKRYSGDADRIRRLYLPLKGKMTAIVREHGAIVRAINKGDTAQAQQAMRDHLSGTVANWDEMRATHPSYFRD